MTSLDEAVAEAVRIYVDAQYEQMCDTDAQVAA